MDKPPITFGLQPKYYSSTFKTGREQANLLGEFPRRRVVSPFRGSTIVEQINHLENLATVLDLLYSNME